MTIILPLEPQEEAKLIALAQEKGVTPDALVRAAINAMLAEAGNLPVLEPIHSCAVYLRNTVPRQRADVVKQLPMPEPLPDKPRIAGGFDFQAKRGFGLYRRSGVERRAYRRFGYYDRRDRVPDGKGVPPLPEFDGPGLRTGTPRRDPEPLYAGLPSFHRNPFVERAHRRTAASSRVAPCKSASALPGIFKG